MKPLWWIIDVTGDTRLSADERILLVWFATQPAKWVYSVPDAMGAMGWGRQKYQRTLAKLKAAKLASTDHFRDRLGRIVDTKLTLASRPRAENQASGKPRPRADSKASGPRAENQASIRKGLLRDAETEPDRAEAKPTHPQFENAGGRYA